MVAIFSVLLTVAFIGGIKVVFIAGFNADFAAYKAIFIDLHVIEVVLWFAIAIAWRNLGHAADWYHHTSSRSASSRLFTHPDSYSDERISSSISQYPDHCQSRGSLKRTLVIFTCATVSLVLFYILQ